MNPQLLDNPLLSRARTQREAYQQQLDSIVKRAADENRQELTEAETKNVEEIRQSLGPLDQRIRELTKDESDRLAFIEEARKLEARREGLPPEVQRATRESPKRSWGEHFVESGAIQDYLRAGGKGQSRAIDVPGSLLRQNLITTQSLGDEFLPTLELPGIIQPFEPPTVLGLVRRGTTTATAVQYVQEDSFTNNAAVVPEGQPKPQSTLTLTSKTVVVETKAHWVAITRQALDDIPMIRGYIDGRLRDGLIQKIADEVLNGEGDAPGLLTGAQRVSGTDLFQAVLAGMAAIQAAGYQPTGVVCNGTDFYSLVASLTVLGGVGTSLITDAFPYRIFGLPLLVTPGMPAGTALVGDFANGAQLWDRQQTQVLVTDSHADFFIRNTLVILAEWRGALAVYAPGAFAQATIAGEGGGDGGSRVRAQPGQTPAQAEATVQQQRRRA